MSECIFTLGNKKNKKVKRLKCIIDDPLSDDIDIAHKSHGVEKKVIKIPVSKSNESSSKEKKDQYVGGHVFSYSGSAIDVIFDDNNEPWFRGQDICKILLYNYPAQAIRKKYVY